MEEKIKNCIDRCTECSVLCSGLFSQQLSKGEQGADTSLTAQLLDCAELCKVAEGFLLRGSDFADSLCHLSAEVCERCAESCEQVDNEEMKKCAAVCLECAESCRVVANA